MFRLVHLCVTIALERKSLCDSILMAYYYFQLLAQPCDQKVIMWLTQRVTNWKFIARWLELGDIEVKRIETDYKGEEYREQCYQMFMKWKASDPDNYNYVVLGEALKKENPELYNEYLKEVERVEETLFD